MASEPHPNFEALEKHTVLLPAESPLFVRAKAFRLANKPEDARIMGARLFDFLGMMPPEEPIQINIPNAEQMAEERGIAIGNYLIVSLNRAKLNQFKANHGRSAHQA